MTRQLRYIRKRRSGFILVTVVAMIAVASIMLTRLANTSLKEAAIAVDEESMMRSRWAMASLRRYSLVQAQTLFSQRDLMDASASSKDDRAILWRKLNLGGQTYWLIVADESAKLNIARLAAEHDTSKAAKSATKLLPNTARLSVTTDKPESKRWTEWLLPSRSDAHVDPRKLAEASQRLTLWGSGKLNVLRCHPDTLDELWRSLFGQAAPQLLHRARQQQPPPPIKGMITALGLRESQTNLALSWLSDQSDCFSLWLFCESDRRIGPIQFVQWGRDGRLAQHRGYAY